MQTFPNNPTYSATKKPVGNHVIISDRLTQERFKDNRATAIDGIFTFSLTIFILSFFYYVVKQRKSINASAEYGVKLSLDKRVTEAVMICSGIGTLISWFWGK